MLFVLRLLPSYKKWQQKFIYVLFFMNFAITIIACATMGTSCIPFNAIWEKVPGSRCFSKEHVVAASQVNGSKLYPPIFNSSSVLIMYSSGVRLRCRDSLGPPVPPLERPDEA